MRDAPARSAKEQILDAAETLFAEQGIEGVSLRSLTKQAGVNLASVHYHFGSKEAVVKAAFTRRIRPVNQERLDRLDTLERAFGGKPAVEDVVEALFAPVVRLAQDPPGGRRFMRMCARFYCEPAPYLETLFAEEFGTLIRRFDLAFARAIPGLSRDELRTRIHFAVGVMVHTMLDSGRNYRWRDCDPELLNSRGILDAMVAFVAAGMRAPAGRPSPPSLPEVAEVTES